MCKTITAAELTAGTIVTQVGRTRLPQPATVQQVERPAGTGVVVTFDNRATLNLHPQLRITTKVAA